MGHCTPPVLETLIDSKTARILLKANKTAMAELEYGKLIKDNPENLEYIAGLQKARGLDKGTFSLYF